MFALRSSASLHCVYFLLLCMQACPTFGEEGNTLSSVIDLSRLERAMHGFVPQLALLADVYETYVFAVLSEGLCEPDSALCDCYFS